MQAELFAPPTAPKAWTQREQVFEFMRVNGSITARDAAGFGTYRLAARILELRRDWLIRTETESHHGGSHARYFLEGA